MTIIYFFAAALFVSLTYLGIRFFVRSRARFGGEQVIICPETGKQAMVEVDAGHAALTSLFGKPYIQLENCWRWPLKKDCGQDCLIQLNVAPPDCLVRGVLMKWYEGKYCPFCGRVFDAPRITDHKPALVNPEGLTVEWNQIELTKLMEVLQTHQPVCWSCHTAQKFQREHPDLVVKRPWKVAM